MIETGRPWTLAERKRFREKLPAGEARPTPSGRVVGQMALEVFGRVDRNQDGALTGPELDGCLHSDQFKGKQAVALVNLRSYLGELQTLHPSDARLTREDFQVLMEVEHSPVAASFERVSQLQKRLEEQPLQPLAQESLDPTRIEQGQLGTCVSLASLMCLSPTEIRSMLTDSADGSFTVQLADGSRHRVEDVSQNERLLHSRTSQGERWPALLELAIGQRLKQLRAGRPFADQEPRAYLNQGQPPELIFPLLLGYPGRTWSHTQLSPDQARGLLEASLARGAVIAGSQSGEGIVDRHAYKVVDFDRDSDQVLLANPWGGEPLSIPYLHFYASFGELTSRLQQMPEHLRSPESAEELEARRQLKGEDTKGSLPT